MNGGHYLTKGHDNFFLLYIKTTLMSRNFLEPGKNRFPRCKQPLAERSLRRFDACFFDRSADRLRLPKAEPLRFVCVLFDTKRVWPRADFTPQPFRVRGSLCALEAQTRERSSGQNHNKYSFLLRFNDMAPPAIACGCPERLGRPNGWYGDCRKPRAQRFSARLRSAPGWNILA